MAEAHGFDGDLRIIGANAPGHRPALGKGRETLDQEIRIALVERGQFVHRRLGIAESARLVGVWFNDIRGNGRGDSLVHTPL
ncbi:hypothetical protein D3C72_2399420 [compost metagenome]